jgi:citrate lyase subunit beta/citryl-CoA lyase
LTSRALPLWRSMLFVPVLNEAFLARAATRGADCIQLDLEDSIPLARKAEARAAVAAAAASLAAQRVEVVVRINRSWRMAIADIEASVSPAVLGLTLPKVPDASHVRAIGEVLDELEAERGLAHGHTRLVAMIETAEGLLNMAAIARASDRVVGITVGAEDLALSMGMEPDEDALYVPNVQAVAAARAAGVLPIGYVGTVAEFADAAKYRATAERARRLGFAGGFCIHPTQVPILNAAFSPTPQDIADARDLLAAHESAESAGKGATTHKGKMIDAPVAERARALLARAEEIARKS